MDPIKFGNFIAERRRNIGLTQSELAQKIFVTNKAVSRWETGKGFPDIGTIEPLADALGVSVVELMRSELSEPCGGIRQAEEAVAAALELAEIKHGMAKFAATAVMISVFGLLVIALAVFFPSAPTVWTLPFLFCITSGLICLGAAIYNRARGRLSVLWFSAAGVLLMVPIIQIVIIVGVMIAC